MKKKEKNKWIIVSNRLPFQYDSKKNELRAGSGGLITAISGIKSDNPFMWIGSLEDRIDPKLVTKLNKKSGKIFYHPIGIDRKTYAQFYNGICNDVFWPLLHYEGRYVRFRNENWEAYKKVNELFAKEILKKANNGDLIWIHDFHFFLLPKLLKEANPKLKIGFFLHIPFPSSEIFRQLPVREIILKSVLKADLIGFHDYSYLRHFCSSCYSILGIESSLLSIVHEGHTTNLGVFPVSIDTNHFIEAAKKRETLAHFKRFMKNKGDKKIILGIDRLDYTKGIELKMKSFEVLLKENPHLQGKVQLLQLAIPSRQDVKEYIVLKNHVDQLVGKINGEMGKPGYTPIEYLFTSVSFNELLALYRMSDILLITSVRDGMNLVSIEYVCAQNEKDPGVVMLSEFAGAISTLSSVVPINPWNIEGTAKKIGEVLNYTKEERVKRHIPMLKFLQSYTAGHWASSFMNDLGKQSLSDSTHLVQKLSPKRIPQDLKEKIRGKKIILLLDFDGTLAPIVSTPEQAKMSVSCERVIRKITKSPHFVPLVISGRKASFLISRLSKFNIGMAAEHGSTFFNPETKKWKVLVNGNPKAWYSDAYRIIHDYTVRTPNSFVERKRFCLTWHYRNSPQEFAKFNGRKMFNELEEGLANLPVVVSKGKKVIEVKAIEASKGFFANFILNQYRNEEVIVIAIGDDTTDEDMFKALSPQHISIKVGTEETCADYRLTSQEDVEAFLDKIHSLKSNEFNQVIKKTCVVSKLH